MVHRSPVGLAIPLSHLIRVAPVLVALPASPWWSS